MTNRDRLRALRATRELASFTTGQLQDLLPFIDERCVPAGTELAREGRLCHELLIVTGGEVEARGKRGLARLGPGDTIGWKAMRDRGLNEATVVAASPTHVLVMSHHQFHAAEALGLASRQAR
jgi:CRP-like cAMP-binding protein